MREVSPTFELRRLFHGLDGKLIPEVARQVGTLTLPRTRQMGQTTIAVCGTPSVYAKSCSHRSRLLTFKPGAIQRHVWPGVGDKQHLDLRLLLSESGDQFQLL